jgi:hypothetical protein
MIVVYLGPRLSSSGDSGRRDVSLPSGSDGGSRSRRSRSRSANSGRAYGGRRRPRPGRRGTRTGGQVDQRSDGAGCGRSMQGVPLRRVRAGAGAGRSFSTPSRPALRAAACGGRPRAGSDAAVTGAPASPSRRGGAEALQTMPGRPHWDHGPLEASSQQRLDCHSIRSLRMLRNCEYWYAITLYRP